MPPTLIRAAAETLAAQNASLQVPCQIGLEDARTLVTFDLARQWFVEQAATSSVADVMREITDTLTDDERKDIFVAAFVEMHRSRSAVELALQRAVIDTIAAHIAREANAIELDEPAPGSFAAEVDDPVRADLRAMARASRAW